MCSGLGILALVFSLFLTSWPHPTATAWLFSKTLSAVNFGRDQSQNETDLAVAAIRRQYLYDVREAASYVH